mmetsp:Transcript_2490/g.5850  ORF Transcript_2490/g.5850 Transcript_2490/m.5850 type:complete len:215 (-) Transcript_2490:176-820(-)
MMASNTKSTGARRQPYASAHAAFGPGHGGRSTSSTVAKNSNTWRQPLPARMHSTFEGEGRAIKASTSPAMPMMSADRLLDAPQHTKPMILRRSEAEYPGWIIARSPSSKPTLLHQALRRWTVDASAVAKISKMEEWWWALSMSLQRSAAPKLLSRSATAQGVPMWSMKMGLRVFGAALCFGKWPACAYVANLDTQARCSSVALSPCRSLKSTAT